MLKIENVSVDFDGLKAVSNVNLIAKDNEVTALIGPNGAGKTTIFNLITGVTKPNNGHIYLDDTDITSKKPYDICHLGIARTYQAIKLFKKMSVIDNVLVGMHTRTSINLFSDIFHSKKMREQEKRSNEKAKELLKQFGLDKFEQLPAGSLSYGQQRLLEICRAVASEPKIILLDEPAAGMNDSEKKELNEKIRHIISMEISVLLVEHDMNLVMDIADTIFVIEAGQNLASGTPKEIQNNKEVIKAYLGGDE